jgi:hypothetical protein
VGSSAIVPRSDLLEGAHDDARTLRVAVAVLAERDRPRPGGERLLRGAAVLAARTDA